MQPTLVEGMVVMLDQRAFRSRPPRPGDVVVLMHPTRSALKIVKRIASVGIDTRCVVMSDNTEVDATDSRQFGPIDPELLIGKVTSYVRSGRPND
jgi:nickel-type superoxide dismutase maturation protease